ncbi:MAG TPA: hypothetical protein VF874_04775 [Mycobacterium sp.]
MLDSATIRFGGAKVSAALGVLGVLPLVHTWIPLPAALSSLVWIFLIGLVMLVAPSGVRATPESVDDSAGTEA